MLASVEICRGVYRLAAKLATQAKTPIATLINPCGFWDQATFAVLVSSDRNTQSPPTTSATIVLPGRKCPERIS